MPTSRHGEGVTSYRVGHTMAMRGWANTLASLPSGDRKATGWPRVGVDRASHGQRVALARLSGWHFVAGTEASLGDRFGIACPTYWQREVRR